jgi:ATP-binding cassette subfamily B protein
MFEITDAAVERVVEVLDTQPLDADPDARITRFDVAFDEVGFAYAEGGAPVLRGVTFAVPARSFTALVGPSGSGKTTVTKLLTRYADPDAGTVRIGGVDLRTVDPSEIYRHVSVVFQDVYLFDDTIRANIAMARPDATDAEVEAAARAANVHGFVERLPHGYETRVGEIGGSLSGGERQRISIARAILKDAPIVLLDEPTAALDAESEVAVQQAIDALVADRTVVVIAHRMSTVVGADQILVLTDGRIAERGRHAELLAAGGRYARMWEAQTRARHWRVGAETAKVGTDG